MATDTRVLIDLNDVRVLMTTVTSNVGPHRRYTMLRITDDTSGQLIAEVSIPPDQLINLLGNSDAVATARASTATHRWGKQHQHETRRVDIPREVRTYGEQPDHPLVLEAKSEARADGWETVSYRYSHGKHELVCRRWVAPDEG